jgi:hypothetical protein
VGEELGKAKAAAPTIGVPQTLEKHSFDLCQKILRKHFFIWIESSTFALQLKQTRQ